MLIQEDIVLLCVEVHTFPYLLLPTIDAPGCALEKYCLYTGSVLPRSTYTAIVS